MCRLTAYVGPPAPLSALVFGGEHSLFRQSWEPRELLHGSVNADGYGVVWYPRGGEGEAPVRVARAEPVWFDPDLEGLLASVQAPVAVAALRNATPGLPVDRTAVLPLVHGSWAFVLNGFVPRFRERHMRALRQGLPDDLYGSLRGVSDSETLFLLAVDALRAGAPPLEALEGVVEHVARQVGPDAEARLTMVLAHPTGVWALNGGVGSGPRNSLYVTEDSSLAPEGTLLASEPLDAGSSWTPVPPDGAVAMTSDGARVTGPGGR